MIITKGANDMKVNFAGNIQYAWCWNCFKQNSMTTSFCFQISENFLYSFLKARMSFSWN